MNPGQRMTCCGSALIGLAMAFSLAAQPTDSMPSRSPVSEADIAALDTNKDGRLSLNEARGDKKLAHDFSRLDRNSDGLLDTAEITGTGGGSLGDPEGDTTPPTP